MWYLFIGGLNTRCHNDNCSEPLLPDQEVHNDILNKFEIIMPLIVLTVVALVILLSVCCHRLFNKSNKSTNRYIYTKLFRPTSTANIKPIF